MTCSPTIMAKTLSVLAVTCAVAVFYTAPAAAQNASNLVCNGCVNSIDIQDSGVKRRDIRNNAVNTQKIKNGAVTNSKIADDAVNGQKIADGTVGNADIAGDAVTGDKILDGAVSGADVLDNSLSGTDVQNNSLNSSDVAGLNRGDITDEAGADFQGANEREAITATDETVRFVSISAPSSGRVIVVASGTWDENGTPTNGRCSITTGTTVTTFAALEATLGNEADEDLTPFALTRGFNVAAGTTTFRLVCDITTTGSAFILDAQMTAMYFPTSY